MRLKPVETNVGGSGTILPSSGAQTGQVRESKTAFQACVGAAYLATPALVLVNLSPYGSIECAVNLRGSVVCVAACSDHTDNATVSHRQGKTLLAMVSVESPRSSQHPQPC